MHCSKILNIYRNEIRGRGRWHFGPWFQTALCTTPAKLNVQKTLVEVKVKVELVIGSVFQNKHLKRTVENHTRLAVKMSVLKRQLSLRNCKFHITFMIGANSSVAGH